MKKEELKVALNKIHAPKLIYNLEGDILPNNTVLVKSDSNWRVISIDDRGNIFKEQIFLSEDDACNYIFALFKPWFDYELRSISRILSLLTKRPQLNSQSNFRDHFFKKLDFKFPEQLKLFYNFYNGAEGYIGKNSFVTIWPIEALEQRNKRYNTKNDLSDFYLFAQDNNLSAFAINKKNSQIYEFRNVRNMNLNECAFCANDFEDFLLYLFDN